MSGQNRLKDRISLIQKTETPWSRWKAGRLPRSKPVVAVKPLKDKNTVGGEGRGQSGGNKGEKVEGGCRKKVVNIGYAFAKRRRHRKPRPDCNGRGRLMGLPKIDGGCTVVAWNTRTANFFPRPTTSPYTFTPLSPRPRRSPAVIFPPSIRYAPFLLLPRKEIASSEPASPVKNIDWPDYIVYPGIIESRRENIFRYSLEGGNLFLRRPRLTNREEKRAISVPRFETTWPRMGWNLWRKRSRTRI